MACALALPLDVLCNRVEKIICTYLICWSILAQRVIKKIYYGAAVLDQILLMEYYVHTDNSQGWFVRMPRAVRGPLIFCAHTQTHHRTWKLFSDYPFLQLGFLNWPLMNPTWKEPRTHPWLWETADVWWWRDRCVLPLVNINSVLPQILLHDDKDAAAHNVLLSSFRSTFIFCFSMTASNSVALLASCRNRLGWMLNKV